MFIIHKHRVFRADCGLFDKPSHGKREREAVYNLTRKLKRKIDEAISGEPVIAHYRSHPFCVGMELVLGGRLEPFREFDFGDCLKRVHKIYVYRLSKEDLGQ